MTEEKTSPTVGYKPDGTEQVFHLKPGEKLPEGWLSRPAKGHHPTDARHGIHTDAPSKIPDTGGAHAGEAKGGLGEKLEEAAAKRNK